MPDRKRVAAFVDAVVNGDHADAIRDYYHEEASMQENDAEPRQGREVLIKHERAALARVQSIHTHPPSMVLVDGDHVMIAWRFDMTDQEGITRRLNEVAVQTWRGDRILTEKFIYDSATAWQPINT